MYSGGGGGGGAAAGTSLAARRAQRQRERREKKALDKQKQAQSKAKAEAAASRAAAGARVEAGVAVTAAEAAPGVGPRSRSGGAKRNIGGGAWSDGVGGGARKVPPTQQTKRSAAAHIPALAPSPSNNKRAKVRRNGHEAHDNDASGDEDDDDGFDEDEDDEDDDDHDAAAAAVVEEVPSVKRTGAYGSYGRAGGRMSAEDDEWATSSRTWASLSPYLSKFHEKKVWMPFYYDGAAGRRLKHAGFRRVVHRREDFFARVNDGPFIRSVDVVVDNPPYTGKGMKERVLTALVKGGIPFCLLLPLGVLHGAMVRQLLDPAHVQALIPRRCWVSKAGGKEVPFKYLVWLCYKLELDRDLVLMPET